ncbi:hypothetical protein J6590_018992 [Homalodisca vitripennis]|nr:hypothetical protein J6590_018992 [Homalodisca vitripennis]
MCRKLRKPKHPCAHCALFPGRTLSDSLTNVRSDKLVAHEQTGDEMEARRGGGHIRDVLARDTVFAQCSSETAGATRPVFSRHQVYQLSHANQLN